MNTKSIQIKNISLQKKYARGMLPLYFLIIMKHTITVRVCQGKACAHETKKLLKAAEKKGVKSEPCLCLGQCKKAPNVQIICGNQRVTKNQMTPAKLHRELDIMMGKKTSPSRVPESAKKAMNSLLSGGF